MGIIDEVEKMDEAETIKGLLKRIEKLEEQNQKLLKALIKQMRMLEGVNKGRGKR